MVSATWIKRFKSCPLQGRAPLRPNPLMWPGCNYNVYMYVCVSNVYGHVWAYSCVCVGRAHTLECNNRLQGVHLHVYIILQVHVRTCSSNTDWVVTQSPLVAYWPLLVSCDFESSVQTQYYQLRALQLHIPIVHRQWVSIHITICGCGRTCSFTKGRIY